MIHPGVNVIVVKTTLLCCLCSVRDMTCRSKLVKSQKGVRELFFVALFTPIVIVVSDSRQIEPLHYRNNGSAIPVSFLGCHRLVDYFSKGIYYPHLDVQGVAWSETDEAPFVLFPSSSFISPEPAICP